jgi:hypothetical protein
MVFSSLLPALASAYSGARNQQGVQMRWAVEQVAVALDAERPSKTLDAQQVERALDAALTSWSALPEARVVFEHALSGKTLVRFHHEKWPYAKEHLAVTILVAREKSGEIVSGTIEINEQHNRFGAGGYDLQAVLTHELGHLLGLGHSDDAHATMFASTAPGELTQRDPNDDDRAGVAWLYPPVSPPIPAAPSVPASPTSSAPVKASTPPASGCQAAPGGACGNLSQWVILMLVAFMYYNRRHGTAAGLDRRG